MTDRTRLPRAALFLAGEELATGSGGTHAHVNPATGHVQADVPLAGASELEAAVQRAVATQGSWRSLVPTDRQRILLRLADLLEAHADEFADLAALEIGAPVATSTAATATAAWTRYYSGWIDKLDGRVVPTFPHGSLLDYVVQEPYGVVGIVLPWNAPLVSLGMKVVPALAARNCVVAKPSELAPWSALRFAQLAREAGLPDGVLSVLSGTAAVGEAIVAHPDIRKVSFTGGTATGKRVIAAAAAQVKPLTLELGGKSASIVFADADLRRAVALSAEFGFRRNAGQGCALGTRLYVERSCYDEVVERIVEEAGATVVGDPRDRRTTMGPVISAEAAGRIVGAVGRAVADSEATVLTGGGRVGGALSSGFFVEPTIVADVSDDATLVRDELFGPVLAVMPFLDEDEVVARANDSAYGLAAYVHTSDLAKAHRTASALEAGSIGVNGFSLYAGAPFGGYKHSGFGREGGREGLDEFLQTKNVYIAT